MPADKGMRPAGGPAACDHVVTLISSIANQDTQEERVSLAVLAMAIRDLAGACPEPGCDAAYFFDQGLHAFWCVQIGITPSTVTRLIRHYHLF